MALSPSERTLVMGVLEQGPVSRHELLKTLDLSAPSLTRLSKRFLDSGVFTEIKNIDAGQDEGLPVGRPSKGYEINAAHGQVIGVKLTDTNAYGVLTDLTGRVLESTEVPLPGKTPSDVVGVVVDLVESMRTPEVLGLGVALGGYVTTEGVVTRARFLGWRDVDLKKLLENALGLPVTVENDVIALADGLRLFGVAKEESDFALVTIGAGVGHALVLRNQVVRTEQSGLGLGGHIPLDDSGPCCEVGHKGCSQAMLSTGAMTAQLAAVLGHEVSYEELLHMAEEGEGAAWAIVEASARSLGRMLAINANLSAFNVVVLGGEGTGLWDVAEEHVLAELERYRDPESAPMQVLVDQSGFGAWALGAAAVALQTYLNNL